MKKKIRIISLVSLLLLSIFSTQSVLASESVDDENDNGGYVADDTERLEVPFEHDGYSLTTKYDPRESKHGTVENLMFLNCMVQLLYLTVLKK